MSRTLVVFLCLVGGLVVLGFLGVLGVVAMRSLGQERIPDQVVLELDLETTLIEDIPDDPAAWNVKVRSAATLAANLAGMRKEAALYKDLATLRLDAPLTESLADLRWRGPDIERLKQVCEELGDRSLVERARAVKIA